MVGVGEEIGALDKMFLSASDYYEIELKNSTEGLSALIEPIITLIMGVFIALFVGVYSFQCLKCTKMFQCSVLLT